MWRRISEKASDAIKYDVTYFIHTLFGLAGYTFFLQRVLSLVKKFESIQILRLHITPVKVQKRSDVTKPKRVSFSTNDVTTSPPVTIEYVPAAGARLSTASSVFTQDANSDVTRRSTSSVDDVREGGNDEAMAYAPVKRRSMHDAWKSDPRDARQLFRQSAIELGSLHVVDDAKQTSSKPVRSRPKMQAEQQDVKVVTDAEKKQAVLDALEDAFPNVLSSADIVR